jgi:hypothetical protein
MWSTLFLLPGAAIWFSLAVMLQYMRCPKCLDRPLLHRPHMFYRFFKPPVPPFCPYCGYDTHLPQPDAA